MAKALVSRGFECVPFAEPIKLMLTPLLSELGFSKQEVHRLLYVDKADFVPVLGVSSRHLLQTLGTEWARQCIDPSVWLRVWRRRVGLRDLVVVDDVRFENEAEFVRACGGEVWKVVRPDAEVVTNHASEGGLDLWPHFARVVVNSGSLEDLRSAVASIPLG